MRRSVVLVLGAVAAVVIAGCVGDTDPASPVRGTLAQLNAHGHTNNGPAYWWWEYDTSQTIVANDLGTQTPHRGPASASSDVALSEVVRNLHPVTTYYFRACGQDQNSSTKACGRILSFQTQVASTLSENAYYAVFEAARGIRNAVTINAAPPRGDLRFDDPIQNGFGASISASPPCASVYTTGTRDDGAACPIPSTGRSFVNLGDLDDKVTVNVGYPTVLNGQGGSDILYGGPAGDNLTGGTGVAVDYLRGNDGNDEINAVGGSRTDGDDIDCGPGLDTLYTDAGSLADNFGAKNCETIIPVSSGDAADFNSRFAARASAAH